MIIWAIPGAGKSHFKEKYLHLDIIDWDEWQRSYRSKHPRLQNKVGFRKFISICLDACIKHNPNSVILTSKVLHIEIADVVIVHSNLEKFLSSTNRPGREVWTKEKCSKRIRQYMKLIHLYNKQHFIMLDDEFFSDTVDRLGLLPINSSQK